jgi:chitinase
VIDSYDITCIDFDIEGTAVRGPSVERRSRVMKRLQDVAKETKSSLRIWLTLPVTPHGLMAAGRNVVNSAIKAGVELDGVNIMTMAFGTGPAKAAEVVSAAEALVTQLRAIYLANGIRKSDAQLYAMVGVTPDLHEVNEQQLRQIVKWAGSKKIGRLSFWEACPGHNHDAKQIAAAAKIFAQFTSKP